MTITEENRFRLHQRLEQLLGPDEAATLMEHLPPVGWADVATKHDLRSEIGLLRADLRAEVQRDLRLQLLAIMGFNSALAAATYAVARLA